MKIAVLAGGLSPERDVSLSSGSLIANALSKSGHRVVLVDSFVGIDIEGDVDKMFISDAAYSYSIPEIAPDLEKLRREHPENKGALIGKNVIEICRHADIVFMAMHGAAGENGQIQALFDLYGIKYTGSGYEGSLLAMNKCISKEIMLQSGIPTAPGILVRCDVSTVCEIIDEVEGKVGYPCVVKPSSCGSSVGVSIVKNRSELEKALKLSMEYGDELVIEKKISGREFSVGVLKGRALLPIEIIPKAGFYDYKNKYQADMTVEICPAEITKDEQELMQKAALESHRALRLGSYSRADFILEESTGRAYCLEVNTLPGMTPASLLPKEAAAEGISYEELCNIIAGA